MSAITAEIPTRAATTGALNFLDDSCEPSLYRNGKVLTRRDADGSDGGSAGVNLERRQIRVFSARAFHGAARLTLDRNGFELLQRPLDDAGLDFLDSGTVVRDYYPQCARLVEAHTGAQAFAFDHNVRSASGKQSRRRLGSGQQVQGPAHVVHGDYTLFSAPERLRQLARPPSGNDTLKPYLETGTALISPALADRALRAGGRFAIINVWRNIAAEPVQTHPLTLCDGQTVAPRDLVVFEIHYQDRIGENYFARFSPLQRFYYYPHMTRDEALLIKQWDSAGPLARTDGAAADASDETAPCTFSFHSAFEDQATPADAPDRWSIEVRCMVLYD